MLSPPKIFQLLQEHLQKDLTQYIQQDETIVTTQAKCFVPWVFDILNPPLPIITNPTSLTQLEDTINIVSLGNSPEKFIDPKDIPQRIIHDPNFANCNFEAIYSWNSQVCTPDPLSRIFKPLNAHSPSPIISFNEPHIQEQILIKDCLKILTCEDGEFIKTTSSIPFDFPFCSDNWIHPPRGPNRNPQSQSRKPNEILVRNSHMNVPLPPMFCVDSRINTKSNSNIQSQLGFICKIAAALFRIKVLAFRMKLPGFGLCWFAIAQFLSHFLDEFIKILTCLYSDMYDYDWSNSKITFETWADTMFGFQIKTADSISPNSPLYNPHHNSLKLKRLSSKKMSKIQIRDLKQLVIILKDVSKVILHLDSILLHLTCNIPTSPKDIPTSSPSSLSSSFPKKNSINSFLVFPKRSGLPVRGGELVQQLVHFNSKTPSPLISCMLKIAAKPYCSLLGQFLSTGVLYDPWAELSFYERPIIQRNRLKDPERAWKMWKPNMIFYYLDTRYSLRTVERSSDFDNKGYFLQQFSSQITQLGSTAFVYCCLSNSTSFSYFDEKSIVAIPFKENQEYKPLLSAMKSRIHQPLLELALYDSSTREPNFFISQIEKLRQICLLGSNDWICQLVQDGYDYLYETDTDIDEKNVNISQEQLMKKMFFIDTPNSLEEDMLYVLLFRKNYEKHFEKQNKQKHNSKISFLIDQILLRHRFDLHFTNLKFHQFNLLTDIKYLEHLSPDNPQPRMKPTGRKFSHLETFGVNVEIPWPNILLFPSSITFKYTHLFRWLFSQFSRVFYCLSNCQVFLHPKFASIDQKCLSRISKIFFDFQTFATVLFDYQIIFGCLEPINKFCSSLKKSIINSKSKMDISSGSSAQKSNHTTTPDTNILNNNIDSLNDSFLTNKNLQTLEKYFGCGTQNLDTVFSELGYTKGSLIKNATIAKNIKSRPKLPKTFNGDIHSVLNFLGEDLGLSPSINNSQSNLGLYFQFVDKSGLSISPKQSNVLLNNTSITHKTIHSVVQTHLNVLSKCIVTTMMESPDLVLHLDRILFCYHSLGRFMQRSFQLDLMQDKNLEKFLHSLESIYSKFQSSFTTFIQHLHFFAKKQPGQVFWKFIHALSNSPFPFDIKDI